MLKSTSALLLLVLSAPAWAGHPAPEPAQPPYVSDSGSLEIRCGALIDGISDQVRHGVTVVMENGRITAVKETTGAATGLPLLDLSDHTCLPGLIEMHAHVLESFEELVDLTLYYGYSLDDYLEKGRDYARISLDAGFTTMRDLGAYYGWADRLLRDEINRGEASGPRLQASGFYLTVPGGGGDLLEVDGSEEDIPPRLRMGVSRSPEEFRRNAQAAVDGGADVIKIIASGAVLAYGGVPGEPEMSPDDIAAVVEVAHAAGLKVAAHAHGAQSVRESILAGADTIEHATYIDEEGIRLAIEHDVALSMDIGPGDWMIGRVPAQDDRDDPGAAGEFSQGPRSRCAHSVRYRRRNLSARHERDAVRFHGGVGHDPDGSHPVRPLGGRALHGLAGSCRGAQTRPVR